MPARYEAMLATPWPTAFDHPDWHFEVKWDGFRVMIEWDGSLALRSRRGNDFTASFPELASIEFDRPTVLDGEIVLFDDSGSPDFTALLSRNGVAGRAARRLATARPVNLMVFDVLFHGQAMIDQPLTARWALLDQLEPAGWSRSEPVRRDGLAVFEAVRRRGLEGIVAKRSDSRYRPGTRSPDWRKVANRRHVHALVGGFSPGERSRAATFGALQLGLLSSGGSLRYVGGVGSGFDDATLGAVRQALDQMVRPGPSFDDPSVVPRGTTWVEPKLVALVEFKEWTPDGRLRAPVFKGFVDLEQASVTWDSEGPDQWGTGGSQP